MSTSKEYTISRKVSDTEEEIIQIPYDALADKPDLSVYQTKNDASLKTNDKTVVGAINEVATGVAETLESFGMSLAPQENGKLNNKVYVYPDGYLSQGTSYDASKDLYLSIGDGLTLETIDETNNIWNIKSASAITSVDGLGGGAISGDVSTSGNLTVGCNLTVNGTTTTVDSTTLQVKDKLIEVAHGNTIALTTPAGLVAPKYDGTNSGALVFDSTGTAYVGDVKLDITGNIDVSKSGLQPLATRTGLVGGNLVQYDSSALTLKDSGKKIGDLATTSQVNAKYTKPSGGIPKTDLDTAVQNSLTAADNAMPKKGGTFTGEVKFGSTENFQGYYIKRMIGSLGAGTAYNNLDSKYKDGTYHRMWRLRFPSGSSFWGKIKITLYGGYSSFNASGVMSKSVTCNFNTSNIYNNVGCYDGLGVNVEQDFRISEAIWNDTASAWEVLIWQKNLNGNNSPTIMLECWTANNTNYINAFNGITAQTVELTQSTSYSAQKASPTGGTKTVTWATLPVYENPLGEEIATVAMLEDKQDKITSSNKLSSSLVDGLGDAAAKAVDTAITANSISTNLPTSKAVEERINSHSGIDKVGTVTGVRMNETTKNPSSGVVDLGTVLTDASKFATSAQGTKADNAMPKAGGAFTGAVTVQSPTAEMNPATKQYVDTAINAVKQFEYQVVTELPTAAQATMGKIYLVAHSHNPSDGKPDSYDEFITVQSGSTYKWERIGNTDIDLSGYVTTTRKINNKALSSDITLYPTDVGVTEEAFPGLNKTGTVTAIKINGATNNPASGVVDLGTVLTDASKFATSAQGTKADNALSLDGGTIKKSKTIKMDASANSDGANLKWGTVNSKNPYIGYASDQSDGTFVIGSLLGTNYASGLAIGGGSGNLLWKGAKVATTNDIPTNYVKYTEQTLTDAQKSQARSNIGAGTSNFDGTWGSLYGKPDILQSTGTSTSSVMSQNATTNAISGKLDKTTYEVNKTIEFGRDGALYVGKFKVYDTNVTCEVTSTTDVTYSGKLVIATQNYVIRQMTVYGDAANTVAPNFFIKPSTTSDPYIEVYFKPASWSKNVVHIYGSKIEAEPTDVCTNVPSVPATATLKPKNALPIFELSGTTLTITL